MARIAFALELGGELGHLKPCGALAQALALKGHRIAFVLSEFHDRGALDAASSYDVFQARTGLTNATALAHPCSYADILLGCGYSRAETLEPVAQSWRAPLEQWSPDVVVADYAPTAMLAARALGIRSVNYGTGFTVPPRLSPLPPFRVSEPGAQQKATRADALALEAANGVLRAWGRPPMGHLSDLLESEEEFLCTFPEIDPYGSRPQSGYWGPRFQISSGSRVAWPARGGKRILVYLKRAFAQLDTVIDLLAASEHRVAFFVSGLEDARRKRLESPLHHVASSPMRVEPLLEDCDLVVSHGGELTTGTLTRGVPQLVFPLQYEQLLSAVRVQQLGAGIWLAPDTARALIAKAFLAIFADPRFATAARTFSRRYPAFSPREQRRRIVSRIEQIAAAAGAPPQGSLR